MLIMRRAWIVLLGVGILLGYSGAGTAAAATTGWTLTGGNWHYYDHGVMKTGWVQDGGHWYYLDNKGAMKTGWVLADGKWYFMVQSGAMKTGWVKVSGTWYYFDKSGAMKTGWVQDSGQWYYLDKSGAMKTGWVQAGGSWYYLDKSGMMKTGWVQVSGTWYYLNSSGTMRTGWLEQGNSKYYLDPSGAMATKWRSISGNWYYFGEWNGVMFRQNFADGYYLMEDGRMTNAGSATIVSVAEQLKKAIDVGISQEDLSAILGADYHDLVGIEGDKYWLYTLKVAFTGEYQPVKFTNEDVGAEDLAKGLTDVVLLAFWNADQKAFQVSIDYFDASHKFHHYSSYRHDYEYN